MKSNLGNHKNDFKLGKILLQLKFGYSPDPKTNSKFRFSFLQIFHEFKQQQIKVTW